LKNAQGYFVATFPNGHTVPAIETLEKIARALEMPLYQLMYDGTEPPQLPTRTNGHKAPEFGDVGKDARFLNKLSRFLARMRLIRGMQAFCKEPSKVSDARTLTAQLSTSMVR
jgi:transcriptional regulator with XRE-family HTH domain